MIKFFRTIRQNLLNQGKTGKYLKYAIGEIILVVIGILIALSINNWNEKRKNLIKEKELVSNILTDLWIDDYRFKGNLEEGKAIKIVYNQLYELTIVENNEITISYPNLVRRIPNFEPSMNKNYAIQSDKISNLEIKQQLLLYDIELKGLEIAFMEFRDVIVDRMRNFLAEKGLYKLESLYKNADEELDFFNVNHLEAIARTNEFQQVLFEATLKLNDVNNRLKKMLESNEELVAIINRNMDYYP